MHGTSLVVGALAACLFLSHAAFAEAAKGPLKVLTSNGRYFTDGSGKVVFLTGSHTWNNLVEITQRPTLPNPIVDFDEYLNFLEQRGHNCFRLWTWENAAFFDAQGQIIYSMDPLPFARTGPGEALDGKPKFDLSKFNQAYFDRLRQRTEASGKRGMYVIVMLFNGFAITEKDKNHGDPWRGHPFHRDNNINGLDGDPNRTNKGNDTRTLSVPAALAVQEAYVRKVIDTVGDLDNVLYEITNEDDGSESNTAWQYHMIKFIKDYEATKPKQHPVGMTVQWPAPKNEPLWESPADWVSPGEPGGFQTDPPANDGRKVVLNDTDHSFFYIALQRAGIEGQRAWVWKNFTRGHSVLFMDAYLNPTPWTMLDRNAPLHGKSDPYWDTLRVNMGYTRQFADRMNLAAMTPQPAMASSGFCLAKAAGENAEFLVYVPRGPYVTVDLSGAEGTFAVEWFNPVSSQTIKGHPVAGGARRELTSPLPMDSVLYLKRIPKQ